MGVLMRKNVGLLAVGLSGALALGACGSSSGDAGGDTNTAPAPGETTESAAAQAAADPTGACELEDPPTSEATAPTPDDGPTAQVSGTVGVILPDTTSSTRYTLYDAPLLTEVLSAAGITPDVQNAGGSTARFQQIAQGMIGAGVDVLMIDSIDATSGAAVEQQAQAAGIPVIDYDRVNLGGTAEYYVSFDNEDVGRLQGQTLVDCLSADNVENPEIIQLDGGTDVDNNAVLFAKGASSVFEPLEESGDLTVVSQSVVRGWDVNQAAPTFTQALTAAGGQVDGVLAANDDLANASIGVLQGNGLAGRVSVTGQDAGVNGLQNIITGQQSMTVFKDVRLEAEAAAQLAIALIAGIDPEEAGLSLSDFEDPEAPEHDLKALLLPAQVITQANVGDVIDSGALTREEICNGIEQACTDLGL